MNSRSASIAVLGLTGFVLLAGCAAVPGAQAPVSSDAPPGQSLGSLMPGPPEGEVVAAGMVLDADGDVRLCLGAVMESYPPQCHGIPLAEWSWTGVDGSEQSGAVRWGSYAVVGTFDGEVFTRTGEPVLLALYDPMAPEDPTGGRPGTTSEDDLQALQEDVTDRLGDRVLSTWPQDGYLWVDVVWDDGTWQKAADDDFGADVVIIRSALREVAG